jgi:hypothetical protein
MNEEPLRGISNEESIGTNLQRGISHRMNEESICERISNQESFEK